jgi:hypothetical protein
MLGSSAFAEFPGKSVPNRCQDYGCVLCCPATPVKTSHCQSQGRKSANQHDRCKCCKALAKPQLPPPPPTEKLLGTIGSEETSHHPTKNATFTWNPVILQLLQLLLQLMCHCKHSTCTSRATAASTSTSTPASSVILATRSGLAKEGWILGIRT